MKTTSWALVSLGFHRDGEPCERCGGIIVKTTLSSRPFTVPWLPALGRTLAHRLKKNRAMEPVSKILVRRRVCIAMMGVIGIVLRR